MKGTKSEQDYNERMATINKIQTRLESKNNLGLKKSIESNVKSINDNFTDKKNDINKLIDKNTIL